MSQCSKVRKNEDPEQNQHVKRGQDSSQNMDPNLIAQQQQNKTTTTQN